MSHEYTKKQTIIQNKFEIGVRGKKLFDITEKFIENPFCHCVIVMLTFEMSL